LRGDVTGNGLRALVALTNLKTLGFERTFLRSGSVTELAALRSLTNLGLNGMFVSGGPPPGGIGVMMAPLPADEIKKLRAAMPGCVIHQ
jgi:hypothetical protein